MDSGGACAPACPRHAVAALDGITGAHVDWADSRDLSQWERKALELSGDGATSHTASARSGHRG